MLPSMHMNEGYCIEVMHEAWHGPSAMKDGHFEWIIMYWK